MLIKRIIRSIPIVYVLVSLTALVLAYMSEYGFGLIPCVLCLYQRIPYFIVLATSTLALYFNKSAHTLNAISILVMLSGSVIAWYHVGVEQGLFVMEVGCDDVALINEDISFDEFQAQLKATPNVPCDTPQFVFLGLSMAAYNALMSLVIGFWGIYRWTQHRRATS